MKASQLIFPLILAPLVGKGAITMTKNASSFDWIYTQDVDSSSQDLDGNTTADFFTGNPAEHPAIAAGIASFTSGDFYRGDFGGSLSRANFLDASFTVEISAQMLSTGAASGTLGTMAIFWRSSNDNSTIMYIDDSQVSVNDGGTVMVLSTADNTDGFHTFRLAYDQPNDEFSVWRDGVLLAEEIDTPAIGGADGLFLGDTSGTGNNGDWDLDTMSITSGAFAPIPEPSTSLLAGLAGLVLLRRRRK